MAASACAPSPAEGSAEATELAAGLCKILLAIRPTETGRQASSERGSSTPSCSWHAWGDGFHLDTAVSDLNKKIQEIGDAAPESWSPADAAVFGEAQRLVAQYLPLEDAAALATLGQNSVRVIAGRIVIDTSPIEDEFGNLVSRHPKPLWEWECDEARAARGPEEEGVTKRAVLFGKRRTDEGDVDVVVKLSADIVEGCHEEGLHYRLDGDGLVPKVWGRGLVDVRYSERKEARRRPVVAYPGDGTAHRIPSRARRLGTGWLWDAGIGDSRAKRVKQRLELAGNSTVFVPVDKKDGKDGEPLCYKFNAASFVEGAEDDTVDGKLEGVMHMLVVDRLESWQDSDRTESRAAASSPVRRSLRGDVCSVIGRAARTLESVQCEGWVHARSKAPAGPGGGAAASASSSSSEAVGYDTHRESVLQGYAMPWWSVLGSTMLAPTAAGLLPRVVGLRHARPGALPIGSVLGEDATWSDLRGKFCHDAFIPPELRALGLDTPAGDRLGLGIKAPEEEMQHLLGGAEAAAGVDGAAAGLRAPLLAVSHWTRGTMMLGELALISPDKFGSDDAVTSDAKPTLTVTIKPAGATSATEARTQMFRDEPILTARQKTLAELLRRGDPGERLMSRDIRAERLAFPGREGGDSALHAVSVVVMTKHGVDEVDEVDPSAAIAAVKTAPGGGLSASDVSFSALLNDASEFTDGVPSALLSVESQMCAIVCHGAEPTGGQSRLLLGHAERRLEAKELGSRLAEATLPPGEANTSVARSTLRLVLLSACHSAEMAHSMSSLPAFGDTVVIGFEGSVHTNFAMELLSQIFKRAQTQSRAGTLTSGKCVEYVRRALDDMVEADWVMLTPDTVLKHFSYLGSLPPSGDTDPQQEWLDSLAAAAPGIILEDRSDITRMGEPRVFVGGKKVEAAHPKNQGVSHAAVLELVPQATTAGAL